MAVNWAVYAEGLRARSLQQKRDLQGRFVGKYSSPMIAAAQIHARKVKQRVPRQFDTWAEYETLLTIYHERPCKICDCVGFCNHREPRVDLAELAVRREVIERNRQPLCA